MEWEKCPSDFFTRTNSILVDFISTFISLTRFPLSVFPNCIHYFQQGSILLVFHFRDVCAKVFFRGPAIGANHNEVRLLLRVFLLNIFIYLSLKTAWPPSKCDSTLRSLRRQRPPNSEGSNRLCYGIYARWECQFRFVSSPYTCKDSYYSNLFKLPIQRSACLQLGVTSRQRTATFTPGGNYPPGHETGQVHPLFLLYNLLFSMLLDESLKKLKISDFGISRPMDVRTRTTYSFAKK